MAKNRVANNLIKTYGIDKVLILLDFFRKNVPCSDIAPQYNVTRQRVFQWKRALGIAHYSYHVRPDVSATLDANLKTPTRRLV